MKCPQLHHLFGRPRPSGQAVRCGWVAEACGCLPVSLPGSRALALLAAVCLPVVAQPAFIEVGGVLTNHTVWTSELGEIRVTGDLLVQGAAVLEIHRGSQVRLGQEGSLMAEAGAGIDVRGEPTNRVVFTSLTGSNLWARIGARGTGSWIRLRHADVTRGQCAALDGAQATLEESTFRDFVRTTDPTLLSAPILVAERATLVTVRRCHFRGYHEVLLRYSPVQVTDSLFEEIRGDGIDLDYAPAGCVIRDCTFRQGVGSNIDAVDIGSQSEGVTVERCLMHDFPFDKGVSVGEHSHHIVIRDCLMRDVDAGVAVKDSSQAQIEHLTVTRATHGLRLYEKIVGQGGGYAKCSASLFWGNSNSVTLDSLSSVLVAFSDLEGGYPGTNNLEVDPRFRSPDKNDFRLAADSPLRGLTSDGSDLGTRFPVGSPLVDTDNDSMPDPWELEHDLDPARGTDADEDPDADGLSNRAEFVAGTDPQSAASVFAIQAATMSAAGLEIGFVLAAGRSVTLEYRDATEPTGWQTLTNLPAATESGNVTAMDAAVVPNRFYRLRIP